MIKPIKLHWSRSKPNFGDTLSPIICEYMSGRKVVYADITKCDLVAIGSLMQRVKEGFFRHKIHVWGTGYIDSTPMHRSKHIYHAVRGRMTRDILQMDHNPVFGDPALLADRLVAGKITNKKNYKLGIIPHYKDRDDVLLKTLAPEYKNVTVFDVFTPPLELIKNIAECEFVLSSAMHGLIVADSLAVPNAWVEMADKLRGGWFKFQDYYSIYGYDDIKPLGLSAELLDRGYRDYAEAYSRPGIDEIKKQLENCFPFSPG